MLLSATAGTGTSATPVSRLLKIALSALCCLMLALPGRAAAQSGTDLPRRDIRGYVRDGETGEALPHANVLLLGTRQGAATNTDGYFVIVNAPGGKQTLQIRYIGYAVREIEISDSTSSLVHVDLDRVVYEMQGITVEGEAQTVEVAQHVSQVVLAPAELLSLPNIGEVDVFRSLQLLPGISGVSDGSSGLYVRGGTPDQNLVLFDGMTIYHVDHFFGMFSAFNADAIKDIRVYKGGYPAEFGGRISSVVELTGKTGDANARRYGFGVNLLSANGTVELPIRDSGSFLVSVRRSYTDVIKSSLYNDLFDFMTADQGNTTTFQGPSGGPGGGFGGGRFASVDESPDFYFYDVNSKLTLTPSAKDIVSLSFYRGKDNLDQSQEFGGGNFSFRGGDVPGTFFTGQDISRQTEELTTWGNTGLSGKWSRRLHDRLYSSVMTSYSSYFSTYDRSTGFTGSSLADSLNFLRGGGSATAEDNEVNDLTLRIDNEFHAADDHNLKFGAGMSGFNSHYYAALNDTANLLSRETDSRQFNLYLQDLWQLSSKLELTAGARGVHYDKTSQFYWEPRASLLYSLSPRIRLKGAWGQYHQFVNRIANENVLEGSRDFWILADEELAPNFAEHYIAGASYETDNFLFDVEGYYKDLDNLVEYTRRVQNRPPQGGQQQEVTRGFFQGEGYARGLDFLLQKKRGKFTGWAGYSLGKVEYTFPDLNSGDPFPASHDRTHELNLVGKYRLGDWELSATWVYATGKAYTSPVSQYFIDLLDGSELSYIHVSDKNSQRLPAYQRLDFSISRTFYTDPARWVVGFSIFNLYNRKNVWYRQYDLDVQPIAITDVTMLGFTPTVYLQIYSR